ncbi:helix-turn-helix transcriptional regulator, partial [Bacteroides ovatus]
MNPEPLRCRILDYTKREMYQHGADGLTMDDIARGMKMSKRTLYKLFPSKTSLFRVGLSDFANGIRSRIQQKQIRMDSSC